MGNLTGSARKKKREKSYKNTDPSSVDVTSTKPSDVDPYRRGNLSESVNIYQSNQYSGNHSITSSNNHSYSPSPNGIRSAIRSPSPNKSSINKSIYVANYPFNGTVATGELSFIKGDRLEVFDRQTYHDWWHAKNLRTKQTGYVPSNYVSPINDLAAYEWYFTETNRRDAERFLEQPHHGKGTFLIRPSDTNQGQESLSILDLSTDRHFHVKHYRIHRTDQGLYYISYKNTFSTLAELVEHYQVQLDGLCCLLTRPCQKVKPTVPADRYGLLELDRNQLSRTELLGKGNYGEVYRGKYGQRDVAIKCMKTDGKNRLCNVEKFLDEAKVMKNLSHKNIVQLYGVCTTEEPIYIVTEFMAHDCLLNYLRHGHGQNISFKTILDFAAQIAKGMVYLEQKQFVHCDLAARNILVGESDVVKIGDFGLAKTLQGGRLTVDKEAQFPIKWTAPEAATRKEYTTKSDVWSFGILLYELITRGANPYPGIDKHEVLQSILTGYRMPRPPECDDYYYQIMTSCWQENPDNRPTFETLYRRFDEFIIQSEPSYRET